MKKSRSGFTIVELLIVIVVIAILAAISIVGYTGIQNRANDSAVQSDLANFAKLIEMQKADLGTYPTTLTSSMGFRFSKSAYGVDLQDRNLGYCYNSATDSYVLMANSKSGKYFKLFNGVTSEAALIDAGGTIGPYGWQICDIVGLSTTNPSTWGRNSSNAWSGWTN